MHIRFGFFFGITAIFALACESLMGQLFDNLQAFPERLKPDDPETKAEGLNEGPKGIATADFNRDGRPDLAVSNLDGTIQLLPGGGSVHVFAARSSSTKGEESS